MAANDERPGGSFGRCRHGPSDAVGTPIYHLQPPQLYHLQLTTGRVCQNPYYLRLARAGNPA
jgi:hypothetical protein